MKKIKAFIENFIWVLKNGRKYHHEHTLNEAKTGLLGCIFGYHVYENGRCVYCGKYK